MGAEGVIALIGLVVSLFATYQSGQQQSRVAKTQEKIAENNATVAGYEAEEARNASELKVRQHRLQVAQILGKQRAAMSATGIAVDEGTFLDLSLDTVEQGKMDELALLHEGDLDVWRAQVSGYNSSQQANLFRASAPRQSEIASSSLITGVSTGLGYYSMFKK